MTKLPTLVTALFAVTTLACATPESPDSSRRSFRKPYLIRQGRHDTAAVITDCLTEISPFFGGKYSFRDTLLVPGSNDEDSLDDRDYKSTDFRSVDSLGGDGFEIIPDFNPSGEAPGRSFVYPAYLVNQTASTKVFGGKDDYVFGLQEALDSTGVWRPIECKGSDFCGNGRWHLNVRPGEFVTVFFLKYSGSYKTRLRVRVRNGDNIYVSKSFDGSINPGQFQMRTEGYPYSQLQEDRAGAVQSYFYGAIPLEAEP